MIGYLYVQYRWLRCPLAAQERRLIHGVRERRRDNGLAHRYHDGVVYGSAWLTTRIRPWVSAVLQASEYGAIRVRRGGGVPSRAHFRWTPYPRPVFGAQDDDGNLGGVWTLDPPRGVKTPLKRGGGSFLVTLKAKSQDADKGGRV